jgi:hypothetical protein
MSFNGNFTITPTVGVKGSVDIVDTSTGSDANLTGRTVTFYKADGTVFLTTTSWAIGDSSITIALLDKDYALNVVVDWTSSSPLASPSTYVYAQLFASVAFLLEELSAMTRLQASNPIIMKDSQFYEKKNELLVEIKGAEYGISEMQDIAAAQGCIDRAQFLITNKNLFY